MAHATKLLAALVSCLLLLQLTAPCVQAAQLAPAAALGRRALLQAVDLQAAKKPSSDIPMAPVGVLQQSLVAANLSSLAYPSTLLSDQDAEDSYNSPEGFQR
jgi:hypothetical protein